MDVGVASVGALVFVVLLVLVVVHFARHREVALRVRFLRRVGFGVTALFTGFFGLFLAGDALSDPGGWEGVGLVGLVVVPLALLCYLAWFRSKAARWVFTALVAAVVAMSVAFAIDPSGWRAFENGHGPVRAVVIFVLAAALAVWGLRRTAGAAVMLLVVGILPILTSGAGHGGLSSLAAASVAPVITGLLYLASAQLERRHKPPAATAPSERYPKAA